MATSASPVSTAPQATVKGTVVFVQGEAYLRDSSGKLTAIKPGDVVAEGDAIVTAAGAIVELQLPSGAKLSVGPERELLLNDELFATAAPERSENIVSSLGADADKVIQALNGGTDPFDGLEEPAAGVTGGGLGDQTHDFVRLVRILEEVTPVSYAYSSTTDGIDFLPVAGATTTPLVPANTPPVANTDATVAATEDKPVSIDVLGNDTDADGDPLTVTGATVDPAKGSVTVNADGTLTFTPAANVTGPVEITYTISDGKGGTSSATTTVNLAPVADAATVGTGSGTVKENTPAQNVASGTVSIVDPDAGEAAFQPQTNSAGTYGSFTLAADGAWTYTLDNTKPEVQNLKEGQRSTETFTVTSIDGTTSTVTITVIGTNDAPVAVADNASTDEDQPVTLSPLANDTDPDADTLAVTNASAANGQVTINPDGTLRYVPDPDFNGTDTVTYTITDGNGGTSTTTVTINVAPAPDAPVAVADLAATNEEQPVTFTVLDNDTDADGDTLTVTGASVDSAKGTVVVNPDGTLTFTPAANVNGPVQITYTISDGKGGTSSAIATVNIAPVNDPASISQGAGTVQEETTLLASGTLTVTDPDADQSAFQAQSGTPGTYGSFSIDAAGHWTYTLDNGNPLVQGLATGDTRSETFTVASLDGTESTVVVTVLGLNEVIGAPGVGIVKEDNPIQTGGQLTASGGASFVAQPATPGSYGSLTLNPDGSWTYTLANPTDAVQSLRDGEIRTETFPVSLSDGTTSTITITVVGTNDPALVSRDSGMVTEDSAPTTNGVLTVSDADAGESAFRPQAAVPGQYGSFTLDAAGNWTYTLDSTHPAVQALGLGDTLSETFPVATIDGTPSRVAITINGTNDAPVVTPDSKVTPEDQPISGALTATDPDGDPLTFALKDAPTNGTVTVKPDGTYTYTPNRDYNGPDSFTVTVSGGKGGSVVTTVSLTVTPLNDDPVARNDANGLVKTDTVPATGNLITNPVGADTDVDGDTLAVSNVAGVAVTGATVVTGLYGTLTIQANGQYSYIPDATNNTVTSLAPGATLQDAFTYTVTDGQGGSANAVLSITIAGANTPPVARADVIGTPEDSAVKFAVLGNDTDPENDTLTVTGASVDPLKGTVVVNLDGTLTFTPAANVNGPVEVTYTISDGKGGTSTAIATVNVTPTPDSAVLGSGTGAVKEDTPAQTTASGTLSIVDPDTGEAAFQPLTNAPGLYGTLTLAADGAWTYTLDNTKPEVQALKEGETRPETFTVTSVDGTTTTVSITVTGTNDGPTAVADLAATNEDQPVTFTVLGNDTDPDGDTLSVTGASVDPLKGTVVVNADGTLTFTPAANVNGPVEVTYTISDGKGGTSTAIATVNVTPTPDTAVLGTGTGAAKEDTPAQTTASGTLSIVNPDAGEAAFQPLTNSAGAYGTLTLAADGAWTYTLDNTKPEVQALKDGETRPETFTVTSVNGTTTTVSITVTGTNDGPTAVADLAATNEDQPVTFTVLGNDTDPDGDTLTVTGANVDPLKGTVVVNADGTLTFTPAANVNGPVEVTYTISDGKGGTSTAIATVNVAPQNDAPVAANDSGAVTEDATLSVSAANGLITSTATPAGTDRDIDGDSLTLSAIRTGAENTSGTAGAVGTAITGTYGTLTVQADGSYTYVANRADALAAGVTATDVFTYTVSDGSKTDTAELVITLTGTNDAPVIVGTLPDFNSSDALAVTLPTAAGFADPDAGDVLRFSASGLPAGLIIDPNTGLITGTLASDASVSGPYSITVTATDAAGSAVAQTFQLAVSNPGPTAVADTLALAESATQSGNVITGIGLGGDRADIDIDRDTLTVTLAGTGSTAPATAISATGTELAGAHGILTLKADGSYSYTATDGNLSNGQIVTDTFSYTVSDGQNGSATTTLTITVTGSNAAPATGPNAVTIAEDTSHILGAADFPFADSDANDSFSAVRIASLPSNGSLLLNGVVVTGPVTISSADLAAGKLSFAPDANESGLNYATFQFQVADQHGALSPAQTFTVNVTPTPDSAVLGSGTGAVKEDTPAQTTASGTLSIVDPDTGEAAFQPLTNAPGLYGTLTLAADGAWTYTLDNTKPEVQALKEGETRPETFTVTSVDGTTTTVSITVTGTNDGPTAVADLAATNEDQPVTFTVLGNDTDPDGDTLTVTGANVDPLKGTVVVNADGTLTFTPAANVNGPVEVTYTISDGKGGTSTAIATVNVTPTPDTAVLGTGTGAVKEDTPAQTTASGTLSIVDPDAGEAAFRPQTDVPGLYGTLTLAADGAWTYTLDNTRPEVQALKEGETRPETFTVTSVDGTTTTVSITVTGTNDGPTAVADLAATNEDQPVTFTVLGNDTDPDGDTLTVTGANVDPLKGTVVVNADGTLTFTPAANVNGPVEVTYTISDGKGGTSTAIATVNVTPTPDTAVLGTGTGAVKEDTPAQTTASGTLSIVDPDAGEAAFQPLTNAPGLYGTLTLAADGAWTYTLDNSKPEVQALKEGETRPETFTVTSVDGTTTTVSITVTGTNDGPTAVADLAATNEDQPVTFTVLGNDTDPDGDTLSVTGANVDPLKGTVVVNADGTLTFTPAANVNGPVEVTYTISDGKGGTSTAIATVNVTPTPDTAVLGTGTGAVKEDTPAQTTASGTLSIVDPDAGEAAFRPQTDVPGLYGTLTLAADGAWTYTLDNSKPEVQALKDGETRPETFTVTSVDGTTTTVSITVTGTNDGPTAVADLAATNEDQPVTFTVLGNDTDPDGDTLTVTGANVDPLKGTVVVNADGTLTFTPAANVNGPVEVTYTISDGKGGTSTAIATVNVAPQNDAPVAANDSGAVTEDATLSVSAANGLITSTATPAGTDRDVDDDTLTISAIRTGAESASGTTGTVGTAITGTYGTLTVQADGSYTYVANRADALAAGVTATDVFTYTVSDGSKTDTAELVITLTGTNDAPVISGGTSGTVTEDITLSTSGTLVISDADAGQSSFVPETVAGTYGSLKLESNGSWVYTLNNSAPNVQGLKQGEQVIERIPVTTADGTVTMVEITVTGTNDAPLVGSASVNVSEEGLAGGIADSTGNTDSTDLTVASGILSLTDADGNTLVASLTAPVASLSSGGVPITWSGSGTQTLIGSANGVEILRATIANDGSYTVKLSGPVDHPDTTSEDVLSIALGVNVSDGVTTSTSTLTVNVEDDSPIAAAASQTITVAPVDTNLLLILDNSASMTRTDGVAGTTRLASAISALNTLLDRYDGFGEVRVRLVTFNTEAAAAGGVWTTVAQAKAQLAAIVATGGTNYDAAIAAGQSAYSSTGKLASGQNIAYFLSDGQPNTGTAIGAGDEAAWKGFLQSNQITSFALGMGTGATQAPLDPIAYNGVTNTNLNGQVISDFNQLSTALQATVPQPANGELLSGGLLGGTSGFGADGGSIRSVTVDGVTYNYDPAGSGSVTVSGGTSHGSYNATSHQLTVSTAAGGTLAINMSTGSYTYTPISTISTKVTDGFSFVLADKDGDTGSSSITFDVSRLAENNIVLSSTTSAIAKASLGLTGEYYGYNETSNTTSTRFHADDKTLGNLDRVSDMTRIVDGRSGQTIVGTYNAATATGADATFSADKIDYGFGYTTGTTSVGAVDGNLGNNPTLLGSNLAINSGALYNFLRGGTTGSDSSELKTTTGIGNTTDSGMRMVGLVNLGGGSYDIRVTADDGFRLNIAGQTVAMFDNIQSPTARTYTNVSLAAGLQPIEILYWEQGGNARLRVEVKLSGEPDTGYKTLGTDEFALFTPTSAPTLNALQDIIEDPTQNGQWLIRTGSQLAGSNGNDDITGSDGRDDISGGSGNDIVRAGTGADLIAGGAGNDTLTGGLGSDTFKWSLADTVTTTKPAVDAITDFNTASAINGGDVLDLHDLLQGESQASGNLGNYLHFEKAGADTVVHVSSTGGYTGGTFVAGATDQKIVLQGVDLTNSGALSSDTQIIQDLLLKGKLHTD